ncbi:MAG TPA: hypothetical protein VFJ09_11555 [Nocardioidaceae bacterium]|jgi:hypothetical protein|nr:hypothetical protein [Nocardioidaceae bacterium]
MSPTWSVKARMADTIDGVQVTGRLRGALDRCYFFLFALTAVICLGATVVTGIGNGLGDSAFLACCTFSVILCGVVLLLLLLHPGVLAKREAAAKEMLRGLFETA